jgi:PAS domain S-box-containing protein
VTRDITERREAEERLRRSENLLSEAQRLAQVGAWEWDISSDVVRWSSEMGRILGLEPGDLQGTWERFLSLFHPDDREAAGAAVRSARENGRSLEYEHRIVRPDGQVRSLRGRGRLEIDDQGRPTRVIGIGQDITERQQIEDALRTQTELYLSMLLAQSELGEGVLLTEGDNLIYANHALEELFGAEAASARSLPSFLDAVDPERTTSLRRDLEDRLLSPLPPARGEAALTRPDGSRVYIGYAVMTAGGPGNGRTFAVLRDETDRRRAVEALETSRERLRQFSAELERAREEESARISREIHDELGQHLTGLKLDLSWLAARLEADGGENSSRLLEKARGMTRLVDETIEQVRRIASELRPGVLDDLGLSAALEWQAAEFESRLGIRCRLDCDDAAETVPPDHATAMFRIFQEALTNVARHAQANEVRVRLKVDGDSLRLTIEDDGRGITDEAIHAGTSLGLLGLRERARLLGGETTIRRRNSRGTIVQVALPLPVQQRPELPL